MKRKQTLSLRQFQALSETERASAVWKGQFLAERRKGELTLLLYNMGGFFVEVTYLDGNNQVIALNPFKSAEFLEPYWDNVSLEEIERYL